jgi:spore maturation protein CgeB
LKHILLNGVEVLIDGGQREKGISPSKYANLMRSSKISLNFPQGPDNVDQCKGRVWEIVASKSLLFERKNNKTSQFLVPSEDYVEFENEEDLINKIKFFLDNEQEMCYIVDNAYKKYKNLYTSDIFWDKIFSELKK